MYLEYEYFRLGLAKVFFLVIILSSTYFAFKGGSLADSRASADAYGLYRTFRDLISTNDVGVVYFVFVMFILAIRYCVTC